MFLDSYCALRCEVKNIKRATSTQGEGPVNIEDCTAELVPTMARHCLGEANSSGTSGTGQPGGWTGAPAAARFTKRRRVVPNLNDFGELIFHPNTICKSTASAKDMTGGQSCRDGPFLEAYGRDRGTSMPSVPKLTHLCHFSRVCPPSICSQPVTVR